jgi:hypothetical protein
VSAAINALYDASATALGGQRTLVLYIKPISASPSLH